MKGQISLEAMLLMLFQIISISLLISVMFVIINTSNKIVYHYNYLKEKQWILEVANEVCILGNGQVRPIRVRYNHSLNTRCGQIYVSAGKHKIKNELGKLVIS